MASGAPRAVRRLLARQCRSQTTVTTTSAPSSSVPAAAFNQVKFQKENVEEVMSELPSFNFYELKEGEPNPYSSTTLDRSILLEKHESKLVEPKVEFSQLENGMKIASIDRQGLNANLGLYVHAGSRFESSKNFGASHMVELMAYKSTAHLSHLRTVKTLEQMGASLSSTCIAGREEVSYQVEITREYMPYAVPLMIGNTLFPRLLPWEVKAAHAKVKEAREALQTNPDAMINELLHKAAYCNNTLGLSPLASERAVSSFTPETVREYLLDHFAPERMVLVGVNVDHAELSKWAMRAFADYNAIPLKPREEAKALYTGGDTRVDDNASPFCHLAIGLESVAWGQAELAPVSILQTILGSASATSTTIGAGVTSRLSTQVVRQSADIESCASFNTSYSDSGLFGIYGVSNAEKAADMATAMTRSLAGLTSISEDELVRAKVMLKGNLAREADKNSVLMKDMGTQLLLAGRYGSPADFTRVIDSVTVDQVEAVARKMLARSQR